MNKQFSKNLKHAPETSKNSLRKISEIIISTFARIEGFDHNEKSINKELGWLAEELEKNWETINAVHVATLLNNLGNLEINDQNLADRVIDLTLKKCTGLLSRSKTATQFTNREITQIFNALPKLPVSSIKYKTMLSLLLERISISASKESVDARDSAAILDGIAKLGIDLLKNTTLIKHLLRPFEVSKLTINELDHTVLSQLWQFCIYAKARIASERIGELTILVDNELKARTKEIPTPSSFQRSIYNLLCKLLKSEFKEKVTEEYPIGSYFLDIAFPEQKINIEVDGPYHYRDGKLKRIHKFRDFILEAYEGWKVIRIPHFEWERLGNDTQAKIDYLLKKLAAYSYLFNQTARERLEKLSLSSETTSNSYAQISHAMTTTSTSSNTPTSPDPATSLDDNVLADDSYSNNLPLKEDQDDDDCSDESKLNFI